MPYNSSCGMPSMIYVMKQKLFSWGDDFVIKDETGQDRLFVNGKAFSLGNRLSFQDSSGTPLADISQRPLSWGPTYAISRDGQTLATAHKDWITLRYMAEQVIDLERSALQEHCRRQTGSSMRQ